MPTANAGGGTVVSIRRPDGAICTTTSSARAPGRAIETCNSSPNENILTGGSQTGGADGTASRSKKRRCRRSASSRRAHASAHIQDFLRCEFMVLLPRSLVNHFSEGGRTQVQGSVGGRGSCQRAGVLSAARTV